MITIWEGGVGQGKTYMTSMDALWLLKRNMKWHTKRNLPIRYVYSNIKLSPEIEDKYKSYIKYWTDLSELVNIREADIVFDDMATYLDSQEWANIPLSIKHWLRLHEHYGCNIYGNAQDFNTIYKSVRQITSTLKRVFKLFGSHRPSKTKPPVKFIWGFIISRHVDNSEFEKEKDDRKTIGWPMFHFIRRSKCNIFDTTQDLNSQNWPPLQHIERQCIECSATKIIHR